MQTPTAIVVVAIVIIAMGVTAAVTTIVGPASFVALALILLIAANAGLPLRGVMGLLLIARPGGFRFGLEIRIHAGR